jgi:hypothetical protein
MIRELQKLAESGANSQDSQRQTQQMRQMARKMLEDATPQQRQEIERLAQQIARSGKGGGGPGNQRSPLAQQSPTAPREGPTAPVDARRGPANPGDRPPERIISEWYSDKPVDRSTGTAAPSPAQAMQSAAAGAERAIEQQTVPPRYSDLVRRVFRRYTEEAGGTKPGG